MSREVYRKPHPDSLEALALAAYHDPYDPHEEEDWLNEDRSPP